MHCDHISIQLGRDDDAYNFVKFWLFNDPIESQNAPRLGYHGKFQKYKVKEGDWLHLANQHKEEVLYKVSGLMLALVAIKIKVLQDNKGTYVLLFIVHISSNQLSKSYTF